MERKRMVLLHLLAWGVLITGNIIRSYFTSRFGNEALLSTFIIELAYSCVSAVCFYLSYFLVAPVLILKRSYIAAFLLALFTYAMVVCARYALEFWFLKPIIHFDNYKGKIPEVSYYLSNIFYFYMSSYFIYGLMYFFAERWYHNQQRQKNIEKEKLGAELAFLRSQVNPHFLFNTINDIYSLAYTKSDQVPDALLKLSHMLRYMLNESNEQFMPLNREVEYLQNVISLHKIAVKGEAHIHFEMVGYIGEQPVAPLLFIAFIENAFKHGVLDNPAFPVRIEIHADNQVIRLLVRNQVNHGLEDAVGGIGLINVHRRLDLIYPGHHELKIEQDQNVFEVNLSIHLDT